MQLASSNYSSNTRGDSPAAAVVVPSARNTTEWPIFAAPKLCPLDRSCSSLRSNERNEEELFSSSVKQLNLDRLLFLPLLLSILQLFTTARITTCNCRSFLICRLREMLLLRREGERKKLKRVELEGRRRSKSGIGCRSCNDLRRRSTR